MGVSLCEFIVLDALLKPKYVQIYRQAGSHRKAGFLFLEWLANPAKPLAVDPRVKNFDAEFTELVLKKMLVKDWRKRSSLAEALEHPYLKSCIVPGLETEADSTADFLGGADAEKITAARKQRAEEGQVGPQDGRMFVGRSGGSSCVLLMVPQFGILIAKRVWQGFRGV